MAQDVPYRPDPLINLTEDNPLADPAKRDADSLHLAWSSTNQKKHLAEIQEHEIVYFEDGHAEVFMQFSNDIISKNLLIVNKQTGVTKNLFLNTNQLFSAIDTGLDFELYLDSKEKENLLYTLSTHKPPYIGQSDVSQSLFKILYKYMADKPEVNIFKFLVDNKASFFQTMSLLQSHRYRGNELPLQFSYANIQNMTTGEWTSSMINPLSTQEILTRLVAIEEQNKTTGDCICSMIKVIPDGYSLGTITPFNDQLAYAKNINYTGASSNLSRSNIEACGLYLEFLFDNQLGVGSNIKAHNRGTITGCGYPGYRNLQFDHTNNNTTTVFNPNSNNQTLTMAFLCDDGGRPADCRCTKDLSGKFYLADEAVVTSLSLPGGANCESKLHFGEVSFCAAINLLDASVYTSKMNVYERSWTTNTASNPAFWSGVSNLITGAAELMAIIAVSPFNVPKSIIAAGNLANGLVTALTQPPYFHNGNGANNLPISVGLLNHDYNITLNPNVPIVLSLFTSKKMELSGKKSFVNSMDLKTSGYITTFIPDIPKNLPFPSMDKCCAPKVGGWYHSLMSNVPTFKGQIANHIDAVGLFDWHPAYRLSTGKLNIDPNVGQVFDFSKNCLNPVPYVVGRPAGNPIIKETEAEYVKVNNRNLTVSNGKGLQKLLIYSVTGTVISELYITENNTVYELPSNLADGSYLMIGLGSDNQQLFSQKFTHLQN